MNKPGPTAADDVALGLAEVLQLSQDAGSDAHIEALTRVLAIAVAAKAAPGADALTAGILYRKALARLTDEVSKMEAK